MSSLIRRMQRTVVESDPHVRLDSDQNPVRSLKGGFVFYRNPAKRTNYRGRGAKLGYSNPKDKALLARLARKEKRL